MESKHCLDIEFNRMARLGLILVQDAMLENHSRLTALRTTRISFHVPKSYRSIWESVMYTSRT